MTSAHTPAPWSINNWTQPDSSIAVGAVGTPLIARVMLRDTSINAQRANAFLIAAAPQLLDALELAQKALMTRTWNAESEYVKSGDYARDMTAIHLAIITAKG